MVHPRSTIRPFWPRNAPGARDLVFWSVVALLVVVALAGGSSRATSLGQAIVRGAATLAAAGWLAFAAGEADRRLRPAIAFLGACAALICLQLVPLPPGWWQALPGHGTDAAVAALAGAAGWRPLSLAPDLTWSALFALLVPAALLVGLSQLGSRQRAALMLPIAVLIFASGILGLAQVTGGPESPLRWYGGNPDRSAIGFLANRNHQALLLACALPILAALASAGPRAAGAAGGDERGRDERGGRKERARGLSSRDAFGWGALGVGAFVVLMLPTTGSRAGLVLGAVALLLSIAIAAPAAKARVALLPRRQRRWVAAGAGAAVIGFAAILVFLGRNVAFSRIATLDPMSDMRVRAFPVVADIARTFFPLGTGAGTFDPAFRRFEPFELLKLTYFNQAHNDIAQLVMEGGALAAALLLAFVLWWLVATIRAWRAPASPQALAARAGSAVVLLCLIASVVDYPLRTPLMLSLVTIAAVWMLVPVAGRTGAGVPDAPLR